MKRSNLTRSPKTLTGTQIFARRFVRSERGATAVEFAILAPVFFATVAAIMEVALTFFAAQVLDSAVHDSARLIRTGQVQAQGMNAEGYRNQICGRLYNMFDCSGVQISVRRIDTFADFSISAPIDPETGEWNFAPTYEPGQRQNIILVEAYYKWPAIVRIPGLMEGLLPDGTRMLAAARVFRNEPF